MNSALSPREIQARLRAGASVPEVAAEAGVEVERIEGFALPVMAERAHITRTALAASVRRRGDGSGHRRLGEIVSERLQARSLDADTVEWDSWRQNDYKWRLVGLLDDQAASRAAEFVFDPKGRFSVADNADARWMIGETLPGPQADPDNENTIDFNDELALVRAMSDDPSVGGAGTGRPGDDVPPHGSQYGGAAHTSELDELYDMLSGVSEDSVRIYLGLEDAEGDEVKDSPDEDTAPRDEDQPAEALVPDDSASMDSRSPHATQVDEPEDTLADKLSEHPEIRTPSDEDLGSFTDAGEESHSSETSAPIAGAVSTADPGVDTPEGGTEDGEISTHATEHAAEIDDASVEGGQHTSGLPESVPHDPSPAAPEQDPLLPEMPPAPPKRQPAKKRASIPSWDEIMFGGPSRG